MREQISSWLAPSTENPDLARRQRLLNLLLLGLACPGFLFGLAMVVMWALGRAPITGALAGLGVQPFYLLAYWLGRRGRVRLAAYVPVIVLFLVMAGTSYQLGVGHVALVGYAMVTLTAGILIGTGTALLFALLSMIAHVAVGMAQMAGGLPGALAPETTVIADGIGLGLGLVVVVIFDWLSSREMSKVLRSERELSAELRTHRAELAQRVAKRTADLEHRAVQLQTAAEVAREATAILDVHQLLDTTVHLISERFGFYHAGAFLVDERGEYAVLRTASSESGHQMLERGHKLQVGEAGIVGYVAATGEPRIVLDVGKDAVHLTHSALPDTHSEMALPLKVRGRTIGVLDIQSTQEAAFSEGDMAVLQVLADQLAVAIENARLVERTEAQLRELSLLHGEYSAAAWAKLTPPDHPLGYVYDRVDVMPTEKLPTSALDLALERGETITLIEPDVTETVLATPLRLHDQIIGTLGIQATDGAREWAPGEIALVEAVSDQVAQALENARLFAETQRRAGEQERLARIAALASSTLEIDELIEHLMQETLQLIEAETFLVLLADKERQILSTRYISSKGVAVSTPERKYIPMDAEGFEQSIYARGGVYASNLGVNDPNIIPAYRPYMKQLRVRNFCGVALRVRDRSIGEMYLVNRPGGFGQDEIRILRVIASYVANAIENAHLFEEAQRRATQLAAAAEVARDATAILDVDQLLDETVHLISEQFGFYHAGVFFLDEQDEYAVLRAASSEGGRRMLERGHKLQVGKVGIVGYVAGTGEPRVALDVGADAVHFVNPDLPGTRSEMGLPLKVRGRVIGVLDVQSTQEAAFSEDDVAVLQTLADQLAAAIANARLFQEVRTDAMRRALINEVQQAAAASFDPDEMLHQAGEVISRRLQRPSAIFFWEPEEKILRPVAVHDAHAADVPLADDLRVTRQMHPTLFSEVVDGRHICVLDTLAPHLGQSAATLAKQLGIQTSVYVPLTTRDQVLGVLALAQLEGRPPEGMDFFETVGANLSVALENARLYQDAVETTEQLKEIDRLKNQFLANMSHELRTPLNSIIGFSRVILKGIDGPITDMQRTDLQAVYDSGQHLLGLINDILDISKIQAGKMELSFEDTDLREVIKGVMATVTALVEDKPVELQQSVPTDLPAIRADPRRIRQVLLNLIGNAAKFTEEGFIRVEAEAGPTEVVVSVADSGAGIPSDKLRTIFEEFTQVDSSSTRRAGGTGLGLSITRHFVEMHGGRIWAESTSDAGSTFYVALPIGGPPEPSEEEEAQAAETEQPELAPESDQRVVLCVDDDEGVITLFRRYLSKQDYRVIGLTDSAAVTEQARQLKPFAITMDVMMPSKDGWQVIQELKADPDTRDIPVIMCTIAGEGKERGLSLGASGYLVKPILEADLVAALKRLDREKNHHRVLVVDDQTEDRNLLRRMIEAQEGYEVVEAASGQEAITLVRQVQPNIIILDLMMPGVDGFAVLESVKASKSTRSIPIIVVTAKDLTQKERDILNRRVETLLQKGLFEQQELLADVAAALERIKTDGK